MARIIYISTKNTEPSGGVKVLFQHVEALRELGYEAMIGHPVDGYRPDWFDTRVPIVYYLQGFRVSREDVVVIPETGRKTMRLFRDAPCRKLVFCQNHFGIAQGLGDTMHWRESGVSGAFACSRTAAAWVERLMGMGPVPVIVPAVGAPFFSAGGRKRLQVAYMPRKRGPDASHVRRLLGLLHPGLADVPWVPIEGKSEREVAEVFSTSAVFLSMSYREGLGLPPLEAMAAGCLVAGFHGHGGLDYAAADNGFWAPEDDLFSCADQLGTALACIRDDPAEVHRRTEAGRRTAQRYTDGVLRRALADYWQPQVGDDQSRSA